MSLLRRELSKAVPATNHLDGRRKSKALVSLEVVKPLVSIEISLDDNLDWTVQFRHTYIPTNIFPASPDLDTFVAQNLQPKSLSSASASDNDGSCYFDP